MENRDSESERTEENVKKFLKMLSPDQPIEKLSDEEDEILDDILDSFVTPPKD